jgi:hypothetical protein
MPIQRITSGILADGAIVAADIADGIVTSSKLASTLSISGDFLANNVTANAKVHFADSDSSHFIAFQAPTTVSSNVTFTLPAADGTNGQVIQTDGSGALSFATPSSTSDKIEEGNSKVEVVDTGTGHILFEVDGAEVARFNPNQLVTKAGSVSTPAISPTGDLNTGIFFPAADSIAFAEGGAEAMRIDSSGYIGIGCTARLGNGGIFIRPNSTQGAAEISFNRADAGGNSSFPITFYNNENLVGSISYHNTATAFNTSSDYRLKNSIAPMTGALAKVALLKPCTYKWNCDGSDGQGFIAHELAEVVPQCVSGEKDAVETYTDEEGVEQTRPVHQGVDTSFLVATLTAAIQEIKAINDAQAIRIETLEDKVAALETNT